MRGALKVFALLAFLCGCAQRPAGPIIGNGSCRCGPGQLCVREVSTTDAQGVVCGDAHASGCVGFTSLDKSCWPSPDVSGLCLCASEQVLASAR